MSGHRTLRGAIARGLLGSLALAAPAVARPPAPGAAVAPGEPQERVIEKKDGDYVLRITIRPGNLKPNRVANVMVELTKSLDVPDPVTGDTMPMASAHPIATVKPPEGAPVRGHHAAAPETTRYLLWPQEDPGTFAFHFTPASDGLYELTLSATDTPKPGDDMGGAQTFQATYRVGVGTAADQTEQSQTGTAVRHASRRPVGGGDSLEKSRKLMHTMQELGYHFTELESQLAHPPARGPQTDAIAEAHAVSALLAQVKGLAPDAFSDNASEFDSLATSGAHAFDDVAVQANGKDRGAARDAFGQAESAGCNECHAKYRFQITDDVSLWPKFAQKAVSE